MSDTNFDPAQRCHEWIQELISLIDDRDAVVLKYDEILGILVADDNDDIGVTTLSTIIKSKELKYVLPEHDELKNYPAYHTRYAECIFKHLSDGKEPRVYE